MVVETVLSLLHSAGSMIYGSYDPRDIRRMFERSGLPAPREGDAVECVSVRFRTVGDISCTCPVASTAANAQEIIAETAAAEITDRGATRLDDKTSVGSMARRTRDGYF